MIFAGHFEHAIDSKNRIAIPAKFRNRLDRGPEGSNLYVVPGQPENTLWLYTERHFESLSARASSDLIPDEDQLRFEQAFFPRVELVEIDSAGRIVLPEKMLRQAHLERDVIICGVRDHLEIWRKDEFEKKAAPSWETFREFQAKARHAYHESERHAGPETGKPDRQADL